MKTILMREKDGLLFFSFKKQTLNLSLFILNSQNKLSLLHNKKESFSLK